MSTPGGVPGGLWAECSGYRTLAEEEEKEALSCFGLKHSEKRLPPGGRPAFNSCPFRNHPTFSAHVAQSEVSNQQKHYHTLHKNDDINRNRVCQQSFLHKHQKKKKGRKKEKSLLMWIVFVVWLKPDRRPPAKETCLRVRTAADLPTQVCLAVCCRGASRCRVSWRCLLNALWHIYT